MYVDDEEINRNQMQELVENTMIVTFSWDWRYNLIRSYK